MKSSQHDKIDMVYSDIASNLNDYVPEILMGIVVVLV